MAKKLKYRCIHWSATPAGYNFTKADLDKWHKGKPPIGRGWSRYGYSEIIELDGTLVVITPYDEDDLVQQHEMTWGAAGINAISRHICIAGGPNQPISVRQKATLIQLMMDDIESTPDILFIGHNQVNNTQCPGFIVPDFCRCIGFKEKNIIDGLIPEYNG